MSNEQKHIWQDEKEQLQKDKQAHQKIQRRPVKLKLSGSPRPLDPITKSPSDEILRRQLGI